MMASSSSSSSVVDARAVEALNSATATAHAASASSTQRRNAATVSKGPLAFNRVAAEHTSRMMQYTYARAHASASKFAIALTAPKTHAWCASPEPSGGRRRSVLLIALKYRLLSSPNAAIDARNKAAPVPALARRLTAFDAQSAAHSAFAARHARVVPPRLVVVLVRLARAFFVRSHRERARGERERKLTVDRALRALARVRLDRARGFARRLVQCPDRARDSRGLEPERVRERARR